MTTMPTTAAELADYIRDTADALAALPSVRDERAEALLDRADAIMSGPLAMALGGRTYDLAASQQERFGRIGAYAPAPQGAYEIVRNIVWTLRDAAFRMRATGRIPGASA